MKLERALNVADLEAMARRRLPRILYDVIASGTEGEGALERNTSAFDAYQFLPRYLLDVEQRDLGRELFGRRYALPFGLGPTGFAGLFRPGADGMMARAAAAADIPFILSGASVAALEDVAREAPHHLWYHLYAAKERAITADLLRRAGDAGIGTVVLTVDNPVPPKRERDMRNGFALPLKLRPAVLLEALTHPAWVLAYLRSGGLPSMSTWAAYAPANATSAEVGAFFRTQSPSVQTWRDVETMRRLWRGRFVVKGIQHPDDARRAVEAGFDGIIVSNHGGKVYDALPSPLQTLPAVKAAAGGRVPVMFDSGVRRGSDILIALALGADFVFTGRATLYGAVSAGEAGASRAIDILRDEVNRGLAMIGRRSISELGPDALLETGRRLPAAPPSLRRIAEGDAA